MMKMKIFCIIVSLFMSMLSITSTIAEETGQETLAEDLLAQIREQLGLSEAELEKLKPLIAEEADELLALTEKIGSKGILGIFSMKKEIGKAQDALLDRLEEEVPAAAGQLREAKLFYDDVKDRVQDGIYDRIIVEMADQLGLAEDQLSQVKPVLKDDLSKRSELFAKYEGQRVRKFRAFTKENTALLNETLDNLKGILTEEQLEEFGSLHTQILKGVKDMIFTKN